MGHGRLSSFEARKPAAQLRRRAHLRMTRNNAREPLQPKLIVLKADRFTR
jgi:hypothetical protein